MAQIQRALLSVSDKTGLLAFAQVLARAGVELLSTGGTARALREGGLAVIELGDYTGFPEMLDGRVKTLHPKVHGGLLFVRGNAAHESAVKQHGIGPIDLVVVNLYPFEQTVARPDVSLPEAIENIDIGGPSMLRSAAKNHESVTVVTDPADYAEVAEQVAASGGTTLELRRKLAAKVYARTSAYDAAIAAHLAKAFGVAIPYPLNVAATVRSQAGLPIANDASAAVQSSGTPSRDLTVAATLTTDAPAKPAGELPPRLSVDAPLAQRLRYGENPHQKAALYGGFGEYFRQLHGKELSYNNILDLTAAANLMAEFEGERPALAILKHTNPCGVGQGASLREAWEKAFATDRQAPFGGILAVNQPLDLPCAEAIAEVFSEVIVAPEFAPDALALLQKKKNLRLIRVLKSPSAAGSLEARAVGAESWLLQERDVKGVTAAELKVVTRRKPTEHELEAMLFGWRVAKHVKSNAIVFAAPGRTLGIGAGQMSRLDASRIAVWKAGEAGLSLAGSVVCSDAFFPFADGLVAAAAAGATAAIQPGGSVRDEEVIAAANAHDIAMVFTGVRHFRH
jgi:phosphoribosylaminoimidazolecarboxamide formyltransferase/IMP cyclohydrolase